MFKNNDIVYKVTDNIGIKVYKCIVSNVHDGAMDLNSTDGRSYATRISIDSPTVFTTLEAAKTYANNLK